MPQVKLTDAAVQKLKAPKNERVEYFDATLPGFGLRVAGPTDRNPEGRRSWILFYRFGGKQKRLTLEPGYPTMGLGDARKAAGDALALLSKGKDPATEKAAVKAEAARPVDTVAVVTEQFCRRHLEGKQRAASYVAATRQIFKNHVLPRWGGRNIKSITRRDVVELLDAVADDGTDVKGEDGKIRHIDGGPIAANRVLAAIRKLLNWSMQRGIIEVTPASLVERVGEETRRERVLSADELRMILPAAEKLGYPAGPFFRMALLTGQRRGEVATMAWPDIDLDAKTWTIPGEVTKAGRGHVVPLSPGAVELLKSIPRKSVRTSTGALVQSPHVFTTEGTEPISGYSALKRRLDAAVAKACKEAEINPPPPPPAPWTIHDLRRTAATEMGRLGVSRFTVGRVLNHADRSVTGIYDRHSYLPEKRHALDVWSKHVADLLNPPPPADSNVVDFREAANV